jgi:hypothetical protein
LPGVHCAGAGTNTNVWREVVCEDALSFKGNGDGTVSGGGAKGAQDQIVQHNSISTISISNLHVKDFGNLYRSCGKCETLRLSLFNTDDIHDWSFFPARSTLQQDQWYGCFRRLGYTYRYQL